MPWGFGAYVCLVFLSGEAARGSGIDIRRRVSLGFLLYPSSSMLIPWVLRRYYPDAEDVYKGAATVTADEDAQGLEEPIIAPVKTKTFSKLEREVCCGFF